MHAKVEEYLKSQREKAARKEAEEREKTLLRLGLWEPEYAPEDNPDSPRYPEKDGERRYRKVPVPVAEEEWAEIRRYAVRDKASKVRLVLRVLGVLCYITGVLGVLQIFIYVDSRLLWLLQGAVFGTLCLGVAESINLPNN